MKTYIGCKIIKGEPMDRFTYLDTIKREDISFRDHNQDGYKVIYPDGYVSWSPKFTFEHAYREILSSELELINENI